MADAKDRGERAPGQPAVASAGSQVVVTQPAPVVVNPGPTPAEEKEAEDAARKYVREVDSLTEKRDKAQAELDKAQAELDAARAAAGLSLGGPAAAVEVMVDTWGAANEFSRGMVIPLAELEKSPYDIGHAIRVGVVRQLTSDEARLLRGRPMEHSTRPLYASGALDRTSDASALLASGKATSQAEAEMLLRAEDFRSAERVEDVRKLQREAVKIGEGAGR